MTIEIKAKSANGSTLNLHTYENGANVGIDLIATSKVENELYIEYGTNLCIELPEGYCGLLFPRSSVSNYHLSLANSIGLIDQNYQGEIKARFKKTLDKAWAKEYNVGDRVAQLVVMPYPKVKLVEVKEFETTTDRGDRGFGSSGV